MSGRPDLVESFAAALRPLVAELVEAALSERLAELGTAPARRRWLTLADAGERLGCSPDAVRKRAKRGRLDYRYQGRRMYVSADSVDEL